MVPSPASKIDIGLACHCSSNFNGSSSLIVGILASAWVTGPIQSHITSFYINNSCGLFRRLLCESSLSCAPRVASNTFSLTLQRLLLSSPPS